MMKVLLMITAVSLAFIALYSCRDDCPAPEVSTLFQVNPTDLTFGYNDTDSQPIFVTAMNVTWKAEVEALAQDWLTISQEADRVTVRVSENDTEQVRTGTITVTPDDETLSPAVVTVTQALSETLRIPAHVGTFVFYGDFYNCGLSNYTINLGSGEAIFDEYYRVVSVQNGYGIVLDLLANDITRQDYRQVEVRTGAYRESMDRKDDRFEFEEWSFLRTDRIEKVGGTEYSGSWLMRFSDGECVENIVLAGGRIVLNGEIGDYTVLADLVTDHGQRIVVEYSGPFNKTANGVSYSTYTEDRDITGLTEGTLTFWGENPNYAPGTFNWVAVLQTPYEEAELEIWFYSPMTDSLVMDAGDYTILLGPPYPVFTVEPGFVSSGGYPLATWIYEDDEGNAAPLIEGTISVVHNGGDNYTITADVLMDNYYKLTASFEGDLEYTDNTFHSASAGFKGTPYRMENSRIPGRNDKSVRYGLKNIN